MQKEYQICKKCILDTSDSGITFDDKGVCHYCNNFAELMDKSIDGKEASIYNVDYVYKYFICL